jgi:hypothetical protein
MLLVLDCAKSMMLAMGHLMVVGHVLCIYALQDTPGLLFQHF